ncbi:MAG TPA: hypothetical protein VKV18_13725 [Chthonomonas sp.]|uniref:hypothetical protein n=1 Tax=Chthonomonas sp. TaxID=2282153 RepID=UPI002B4B07AB|nr:hypothetical protein [Chthonomonas sp.]HLI49731.1 hypothetical protein [Chthonomonas sp.]
MFRGTAALLILCFLISEVWGLRIELRPTPRPASPMAMPCDMPCCRTALANGKMCCCCHTGAQGGTAFCPCLHAPSGKQHALLLSVNQKLPYLPPARSVASAPEAAVSLSLSLRPLWPASFVPAPSPPPPRTLSSLPSA